MQIEPELSLSEEADAHLKQRTERPLVHQEAARDLWHYLPLNNDPSETQLRFSTPSLNLFIKIHLKIFAFSELNGEISYFGLLVVNIIKNILLN